MHVFMLNVQIGSGSAGTIVSDLYHGIIANGDVCKIAYSRGGIKDVAAEDTIKIGNKTDTYLHALKSRLFGSTATYSKGATKGFLRKVDEFKPDIIHIHGLYGYYINMEMLFRYIQQHDIGLVTTLHSCWDFTGHCCYFDYVGCEQWKESCKNCPQKKSYPKSLWFENTNKNLLLKKQLYHSVPNATVVSPSQWMDSLVSQSVLSDLRHVVIHNGVDLGIFHKNIDINYINEIGIDNSNPTVLSVASLWDQRKGLDDIKQFAKYVKGKDINIVVVGLSQNQIKELPDNIIGIKRTGNVNQLITLYSFATVLFNPTYEDNYPTVNLESIACGTPVVTYNTGGSYECTMNGQFGALVDRADYGKLLQIVTQIHSGKTIYQFLDLSNVAKEKMISSYLKLYEHIVK